MKIYKLLLVFCLTLNFALSTLGANIPEIIEDDSGYPLRLYLNLPEELIVACRDSYWEIKNNLLIDELNTYLDSQDNFDAWCMQQPPFDNSDTVKLKNTLRIYAFMLNNADKKHYSLDSVFCKEQKLDLMLTSISERGHKYSFNTKTNSYRYIRTLATTLEYVQ